MPKARRYTTKRTPKRDPYKKTRPKGKNQSTTGSPSWISWVRWGVRTLFTILKTGSVVHNKHLIPGQFFDELRNKRNSGAKDLTSITKAIESVKDL